MVTGSYTLRVTTQSLKGSRLLFQLQILPVNQVVTQHLDQKNTSWGEDPFSTTPERKESKGCHEAAFSQSIRGPSLWSTR